MQIKKNIFNNDAMMTSRTPYDIHGRVVINRAKFDVCTPSSFREVIYIHMYRQNCALM